MTHDSYHRAVAFLESLLISARKRRKRFSNEHISRAVTHRLTTGEVFHVQVPYFYHPHRLPALMEELGDPQKTFAKVHVTGTSGKGSTATFLHQILIASGIRSGLYTSPHLTTPIERVRVDGKLMSPEAFAQEVRRLRALEPRLAKRKLGRPRYHEVLVAIGLQYFAQKGVQVGIIEAGAGGLYDTTNTVVDGVVSLITNVSYDHADLLGDKLGGIALHKAGIIEPDSIVVTAVDHSSLEVIDAVAAERGATVWAQGREFNYRNRDDGGFDVEAEVVSETIEGLRPQLAGPFQGENAALAAMAALALREQGRAIGPEAIIQGVREAVIPARMEQVQEEPTVVLDGAHNPAKMTNLMRALRSAYPNRPIWTVLGLVAGKSFDPIGETVAAESEQIFVTEPQISGGKPTTHPDDLAEAIRAAGGTCAVEPEPMEAVDRAIAGADGRTVVCVTGSLYMLGQVRQRWFPEERILRERRNY